MYGDLEKACSPKGRRTKPDNNSSCGACVPGNLVRVVGQHLKVKGIDGFPRRTALQGSYRRGRAPGGIGVDSGMRNQASARAPALPALVANSAVLE